MDIDLPTEVGPTEETVEALMEYLVCPLLPLKHSDLAKDIPSEKLQKSVAKQVHAATVLYNYYHLNNNREKEFLKFDQFCNLAIMFKPSILQHMKYMTQSNRPTITDPQSQLSLTEKAIMDACTISETLLDASVNVSNVIKEWPVTKVAVFLVDSKKENCFLQFDDGVWSVIEKDLSCEEGKKGKKRKYDEEGEDGLKEVAFSAVKKVAGISGDLEVLEGHVVYNLSQAKTATRFYIVQSKQSISEDKLVPIHDAISSLQGPVVKKISGSWVITPVVEYYYLLPYAEVISKCFSRVSNTLTNQPVKEGGESKKVFSNKLEIRSKLDSKTVHISNPKNEELNDNNNRVTKTRNISNKDTTTVKPVNKVQDDVITSPLMACQFKNDVMETENCIGQKVVDMNGSCGFESNGSLSEGNNSKGVDKSLVCLQKENQNSKVHTPLKVYHHEKRTTSANATSIKDDQKKMKNMSITNVNKSKDEKVDGEKKSCIVPPNEDRTLVVNHSVEKSEPIQDFQCVVDSKKSELSDAALRVLLKKRQKLCNQQRNIEQELTLCNNKIQAIMDGGIGDCLSIKLEAVIDCCNEICQNDNMQIQEHQDLHVNRSLPLLGNSLSNAQLTLRKACEELDDICHLNNWKLPTYQTSQSDGGFVANVSVKGIDFECTGVSGIQKSIREARNSAATHVITKLQQMALNHTAAIL